MVRTSGPFLPSGRSAGSTGHSEPSDVGVEHAAHRRGREGGADAQRGVLVDAVGGLRDEDDVDVADVVELAAPGLAHADDREAALLVARPVLLAGDREARLEGGLGELGEGLADGRHRGDRVGRRQVERRDAHQPPAVGDPQRVVGRHVAALGRDRAHELLAHPLSGMPGGPGRVEPVLRVPHEVVDEGRGPAEHGEHAVARLAGGDEVGAEGGDAPLGVVVALGQRLQHAHEGEQRLVGVGGVADGSDDLVDLAVGDDRPQRQQRRVREQPGRPLGVGEAEPGEGPGRGRRAR